METLQAAELRTRIIEGAVLVLIDQGIGGLSSRSVAQRAGIDLPLVEQQFPSRHSLLATAVEQWSEAVERPLVPIAGTQGAVAYLRALLRASALELPLMRVLSAMTGASTDPRAPGAQYYRALYRRFVERVTEAFADDVSVGREVCCVRPDRAARQLVAVHDGLRLQALLIPGTDLVGDFDRAVDQLRTGWATPHTIADEPHPAR